MSQAKVNRLAGQPRCTRRSKADQYQGAPEVNQKANRHPSLRAIQGSTKEATGSIHIGSRVENRCAWQRFIPGNYFAMVLIENIRFSEAGA
jgi:hypothetical protein